MAIKKPYKTKALSNDKSRYATALKLLQFNHLSQGEQCVYGIAVAQTSGNISSYVTSVRISFAISTNVFDKLFSKPGINSSMKICAFSLIIWLPISPSVRSPLNKFSKRNFPPPTVTFKCKFPNFTYSNPFFPGTFAPTKRTTARVLSVCVMQGEKIMINKVISLCQQYAVNFEIFNEEEN